MSNLNTATATVLPVFSTNARKSFSAVKAEGVINAVLPFIKYPDEVSVSPSKIGTNKVAAYAAIGGKVTPLSMTSGAAWLISAHSYGQIGDIGKEMVDAKVPSPIAYAIAHVAGMVKRGGGIDARHLRLALAQVWDTLLSLPASKPKEIEGEKPPIDGESKVVANVEPVNHIAIAHKQALACYARLLARRELRAAQAEEAAQDEKAAREQAAKIAADEPQQFLELFAKLERNNHDQALVMLQEMAALIGYRLSKIPAKKEA